jgi:hypothetical protein
LAGLTKGIIGSPFNRYSVESLFLVWQDKGQALCGELEVPNRLPGGIVQAKLALNPIAAIWQTIEEQTIPENRWGDAQAQGDY